MRRRKGITSRKASNVAKKEKKEEKEEREEEEEDEAGHESGEERALEKATEPQKEDEDEADDEAEDGEFIVEKIIGKQIRNKRVEYLLEWKGYPASENSWEPSANLGCFKMIREYEASLKTEEKTKGSSARKRSLKSKDEELQSPPSPAKRGRRKKSDSSLEEVAVEVRSPKGKAAAFGGRRAKRRGRPPKEQLASPLGRVVRKLETGQTPAKIVGTEKVGQEFMFRVTLKKDTEAEGETETEAPETVLLPSKIINSGYPEIAITFYKNKLANLRAEAAETPTEA